MTIGILECSNALPGFKAPLGAQTVDRNPVIDANDLSETDIRDHLYSSNRRQLG